jgi:cyclophilin family peptidyl-prolyl cis-trans isomerase
MTKKNLLLTFLLITSTLLFSACFSTGENAADKLESELEIENENQDLTLEDSQVEFQQEDSTAGQTNFQQQNPNAIEENNNIKGTTTSNNQAAAPTSQPKAAPAQPKLMPEYKTIADFKKIEASQVTFKTTQGNIVIDLYRDKAPLTTANFLDLVDSKLYDEMVFHRVIPDFMAQVGDPLSKDPSKEAMWGTGGPGYKIMDEFGEGLKHDGPGVLSMANSGPNTGGSQIFITHLATPWLDGKHAIFGKVSTGLENLMKIQKGDKIISATYQ